MAFDQVAEVPTLGKKYLNSESKNRLAFLGHSNCSNQLF